MNSHLSFIWQPSLADSRLALRSLVYLRLLVLALVAATFAVWHFINAPFSNWSVVCVVLIASAGWSGVVLHKVAIQTTSRAELRELLIDVFWVFVVVFFAGGGTNPFIYYYLVLTAFSAILLSNRLAWMLCALCIFLYTALFVSDVKAHFEHFSDDYKIHLLGMWINYVSSALVICFFITKLSDALRRQQEKLMLSRENNLKNEQLIGLATVSALTVHNLATPLSTLTLLVEDLLGTESQDETTKNDLQMMHEQILRCRSTMQDLSYLAEKSDLKMPLKIRQLVADLQDHYALHEVENPPLISHTVDDSLAIECSPLFEYALINLINNAIESSASRAEVKVFRRDDNLKVEIKNPFGQSMAMLEEKWGRLSDSSKDKGLGIGSFLANSTIESQGGSVELALNTDNSSGKKTATVTVSFPLAPTPRTETDEKAKTSDE